MASIIRTHDLYSQQQQQTPAYKIMYHNNGNCGIIATLSLHLILNTSDTITCNVIFISDVIGNFPTKQNTLNRNAIKDTNYSITRVLRFYLK